MSKSRSRSRSPLRSTSSNPQDDLYDPSDCLSPTPKEIHLSEDSKNCSVLYISNLPLEWNHVKIKCFIYDRMLAYKQKGLVRFIDVLKDANDSPLGACLVHFLNAYLCKKALSILNGNEIEGKKIKVMLDPGKAFFDLENIKIVERKEKISKYVPPNERKQQQQHKKVQQNLVKPFVKTGISNSLPSQNHEMYGLSHEFLDALDIKLPLRNKIFISNIHESVDEAKLREVFSLAGQVLTVALRKKIASDERIAVIQFDHPLEAVQAISMFNKRELFNQELNVKIDNFPKKYALPTGMTSIGPGLGNNGEPLRGIRNFLEIEPLKKLLIKEITKLKNLTSASINMENPLNKINLTPPIIDTVNNMGLLGQSVVQNPLTNTVTALNQPNSLFGLNPLLNAQATQVWQGFLQQGQLQQGQLQQGQLQQGQLQQGQSQQGQLQSMPQSMPQNISSFGQNSLQNQTEWNLQEQTKSSSVTNQSEYSGFESNYNYNNTPQFSYDDSYNRSKDNYSSTNDSYAQKETGEKERSVISSDMLVFKNLPRSVTVQALTSKMSEVGDLKFAEITGQGRAIVRFKHSKDAKRCVELFHLSKVDGKTIEVKFF